MHIKKISVLLFSATLLFLTLLFVNGNLEIDTVLKSSLRDVFADDTEGKIDCYDATSTSITFTYNEPLWGMEVSLDENGDGAPFISCGNLEEALPPDNTHTCDSGLKPSTVYEIEVMNEGEVFASTTCSTTSEEDENGDSEERGVEEGSLIINTVVVGNGDSGWFNPSLNNRTAICNNRAIQQVPPGHPCPKIYDSCFLGTTGNGNDEAEESSDEKSDEDNENEENDEDNDNDEEAFLKKIQKYFLSLLGINQVEAQPAQQQPAQQQPGTQGGGGRVFACHIGLAAEFLIDINYDVFLRNFDGTHLGDEDNLIIDHEYFVHIESFEEEDGEWIFTGSVFDTPIIEWREDTKADFDAQIPISDDFLTSFRVSARETLGLPFDNVWEEVLVGVAATISGARAAEVETNNNCIAEGSEDGFVIRGVEEGICELKIYIEGPHAYGTIDNLWFDEGNLPGYIYERDFLIVKEPQ